MTKLEHLFMILLGAMVFRIALFTKAPPDWAI